MLVIPINHNVAMMVPLRKLEVAKILRSTIGGWPVALWWRSHSTHTPMRTAPARSSHHTAGEPVESMKGKRMHHTAAPRMSAPMGSRVASALKMPSLLPAASRTRENSGRGNHMRPKMMASRPIGALTSMVSRHPWSGPPSLMRKPPNTGPMATAIPTVAPKYPKARPRSSPRKYC